MSKHVTGGDVKRAVHRSVQRWASEQSTHLWRGSEVRADWSEKNLAAVERLAQYVLDLDDDDIRFARVAEAYAGQEWRLDDPGPWQPLEGWLPNLGAPHPNGVPQMPDEFLSAWAAACAMQVTRT